MYENNYTVISKALSYKRWLYRISSFFLYVISILYVGSREQQELTLNQRIGQNGLKDKYQPHIITIVTLIALMSRVVKVQKVNYIIKFAIGRSGLGRQFCQQSQFWIGGY